MRARQLVDYYGHEAALLEAEHRRYEAVTQRFLDQHGPGPVRYFRTPGRINLIGEHTDYNGGFVMPVALDRDVLFAVRPREDAVVSVANVEEPFPPFSFSLSPDIPRAPRGEWRNYFQGAAQELCRQFRARHDLQGAEIVVASSPPLGVPRGAGLSSSTALTVNAALTLVARNEIEIERAELAQLCSEAEWYVGTRGGMMDQFSALLCQRDHALYLDCRPSRDGAYHTEHVPVPDQVQIVLLDSGVHHENVRGTFNQRVAECKIGVRLLQQRHPQVDQLRDVTPLDLQLAEDDFWGMLEEVLPARATRSELLAAGIGSDWLEEIITDHGLPPDPTFAILPRCRHVITENERVPAGVTALRAGQIETFGLLMDAAHASMSEDYAASCLEVDTLVSLARKEPAILGARITGAGWGGGVVALARRAAGAEWIDRVRDAYRASTALDAQILVCRPGSGAGEVAYGAGTQA
jgi:galactokinase